MKNTLLASALIALGAATGASAAVLDFSEASQGYQGSSTITLSNATITTGGPDSYVFEASSTGGFCGVTTISGGDCSVDTTIDFNTAVADLSFSTIAVDFGDVVTATIYAGTTALSWVLIDSSMTVNFAGYSGITSIVFDDQGSTGAGMGFGNFTFTETAAIPLPASLPVLGTGLFLLGAVRRRRNKA